MHMLVQYLKTDCDVFVTIILNSSLTFFALNVTYTVEKASLGKLTHNSFQTGRADTWGLVIVILRNINKLLVS
jgi:hypothetical protein